MGEIKISRATCTPQWPDTLSPSIRLNNQQDPQRFRSGHAAMKNTLPSHMALLQEHSFIGRPFVSETAWERTFP